MESPEVIVGQAQGILMERFGLDADQALRFIRRTAKEKGLTLYEVSEEIVVTRRLPLWANPATSSSSP